MAYEYFISYRRKAGGAAHARELFNILSQYVESEKIFWDLDSISEGDFKQQIAEGIRQCTHFVVLVNDAFYKDFDPDKFKDDLFFEEIKMALDQNKIITPLIYAENMLTDDKLERLMPTFNFGFLRHNAQCINANANKYFKDELVRHFKLTNKKQDGQTSSPKKVKESNHSYMPWLWVIVACVVVAGTIVWIFSSPTDVKQQPAPPSTEGEITSTETDTDTQWITSESWPYGRWQGGVSHNMPDGAGINVIFDTSVRLNHENVVDNPVGDMEAHKGDKIIDGCFHNGSFRYGTIIHADGTTEIINP